MQSKSLRIKSYRSWAVNDSAGSGAIARLRQLELYNQTDRPHDGIGLLTPMEYYQQLTQTT